MTSTHRRCRVVACSIHTGKNKYWQYGYNMSIKMLLYDCIYWTVYQIYHFWMQKLMSILYLCCCLAQNPRRSVECQWLRQQDSHVWRMQQPVAQTWEGCIRSLRCNKHQKVWNPWLLCGHNFNENLHLKKKQEKSERICGVEFAKSGGRTYMQAYFHYVWLWNATCTVRSLNKVSTQALGWTYLPSFPWRRM